MPHTCDLSPIDLYFEAWRHHYTELLAKVFVPKAVYDIQPRRRRLSGLPAITDYWTRNSRRQQGLRLSWALRQRQPSGCIVDFTSCFFDVEEQEYQLVTGTIWFTLNGSRIARLRETYNKRTVVRLRTAD